MASKARDLADLLDSSGKVTADDLDVGAIGGRRNLIINGAMQVAQRGTSFSGLTTTQYTLDRWQSGASGATTTVTQETHTATDLDNFSSPYFLRNAVTTGNNNSGINQPIEDISQFLGKTITLSFYAKGTNPGGGALSTVIGGTMGSGGSGDFEYDAGSNITLTSSWQRFTVTYNVPSASGKTLGSSSYLYVYPGRQPSSDTSTDAWTLDITGVQLEVGSVATPFEHRSYGEELALCQRYYNRSGTKNIEGYQGLTGFVRGVTVPYSFPVEMRATPTRSTITQGTMVNVRGSSTSYAGILAVNKYGGSAQVETNNATGKFQYIGFEEAFDAEL